MVERAEKAGFGVALLGHAALLALLSLRLMRPLPVPPPEQAVEVSLAPDVALQQAAPPSPTPPAASEAPDQGPPEEEAVPAPAPAPPKPVPPKPAPPKPAAPKSAPPKPAPKPAKAADADRLAAVVADAERADAERAAKAAAHAAWVEQVKADNAAKAERSKAAAAKAEAARVAANAARAEAARAAAERADAARADAARIAAARAEAAKAAAATRARGSRLGKDFLKGLADTSARAPSPTAPGATMSAKALADIASAIQRQIQPCADRQVNPAQGQAERIRVTLNLKLNRDGSLAAPPRVINHDGLDVDNRRYLDRVDDLAIAAFVGCAPLRGLPASLYDVPNGWRSINMRYKLPG